MSEAGRNSLPLTLKRDYLSPTTLRLIGLVCLVTAAAMAILNLKRVANLGTFWLASPLVVIGVALIVAARRRR